MQHPQYDVAVIGLGTMGSMASWRLAKRGMKVLGLEKFTVAHGNGGAGGESRIFRMAYKEGKEYIPLLQESLRLWRELERDSGTSLLSNTGALSIGHPDHADISTIIQTGEQYSLKTAVFDRDQMRTLFPQHNLLPGEIGVLDPNGGLISPQPAVEAACGIAAKLGSKIVQNAEVKNIAESPHGVVVRTDNNEFHAKTAIVTTGPWTAALFPGISTLFDVKRSVLHWFKTTKPTSFTLNNFPVGVRRSDLGRDFSFFPSHDGKEMKCNLHISKSIVEDPFELDSRIENTYTEQVASSITPLMNWIDHDRIRAKGYMDAYTRDNHPLIGASTEIANTILMTGFSGHGFKMSPAIGEIAAQLVTTGSLDLDITHMDMKRFGVGP